ncbi:virion core protein, T7 gp14 family [Candidatus Enterovibrio escicola]|uniref:virion core protein, T7 gp14 family n=1 Tax=Candidatus Enterovibrio escicola TaxID=1927127 RepID=UPI001237C4AC|nr:hypothetical protein [Candidatus Enterovibrio escacola]
MNGAFVALMVGLATTALDYRGKRRHAQAMSKHNRQMFRATQTGLMYRNRGVLTQLAQAENAFADDKLDAQVTAAQTQGAAMAAGADSGGGGNSISAIATSIKNTLDRNLAVIQDNIEYTRILAKQQIESTQSSAKQHLITNSQSTFVDLFGSLVAGVHAGLNINSAGGGASTSTGNKKSGTGGGVYTSTGNNKSRAGGKR